MPEKRNFGDRVMTLTVFGALVVWFGVGATATLLFARDVYWWAQSGIWEPYRGWRLVEDGEGAFAQWALAPDSWLGIHQLVVFVVLDRPLSLAPLLIMILAIWLTYALMD